MIRVIENFDEPGIEVYKNLTENQLRNRDEGAILIAESPKVIRTAMAAGLHPLSLLCEEKHISGDASDIIVGNPGLQVFTGHRKLLASLTGYTLTRGVLCAMQRPVLPSPDEILEKAKRVCVIYDVCDTTNIGGIFRSAAALGFDGVILSPQSCDPFNRRAIRVSMGTVFQIPWCFCDDIIAKLHQHHFEAVSMALSSNSIFLNEFTISHDRKYAVILGSEGYGLPAEIITRSDHVVKIPMHHGVDSLNVGAAAAIALYKFMT